VKDGAVPVDQRRAKNLLLRRALGWHGWRWRSLPATGTVGGVAGDSGRPATLSAQVKYPSTYDMWGQVLFTLVPSGPSFQ